ncbi:MAG: DNA gyrase subunit A [Patescibacteria group bacterium]|nr:DNA gyrase subunit A [Patescibacteria group bacterium]
MAKRKKIIRRKGQTLSGSNNEENKNIIGNTAGKREITTELQESYLHYAMSVIVGRALPDVRDGLKPVHRRILWAMWESGLTHQSKFRKSANIVGEVLGKYHPHGDASVYDAMVRMAQEFQLRYPLIQGQGNFGSIDGDAPAAYRYTEARLSKISDELLIDIEKDTVDWQPNYDARLKEPMVLPARLPNLLINGSYGIAVGMATNIPPHNLNEVVDATLYLADNPDAENKELVPKFIKGPDFPTGGLIFDQKAIIETYQSGRGNIPIRGKAEIVERKNRQFDIIITEIPYQVNKSELIIKIAELVQTKKIEGIRDIRDESDKEGLRIVIELKNDVPPQKILNQLFKYTDLQKNFNLNMLVLADGLQPQVSSLKEILAAYLDYRKTVIRRRTEFDLKKAQERAHILMGLSKALKSIDAIIKTIKKSDNKEVAHKNLMKDFKLSDIQATAILEMRLQALAALEREKIESELKEKMALIKDLEIILKSPAKILKIIKTELEELKQKYNSPRLTQVISTGISDFKEEDLVPQEEAVISLSHSGYIKRLPPNTFKAQGRGGKGLIGSEVSEEDFLTHFLKADTHDNILFFTSLGRAFQTKVYEIPAASRTSKGKAIHNFLELPAEENISAIVAYPENKKQEGKYLVMITKNGLIKKTPVSDFENIRRTGIIAIKIKKGDLLIDVKISTGQDEIIIATAQGKSIRFKESQARPLGRTAAGFIGMRLKKGDFVAGFDIIKNGEKNASFLTVMQNGFAKQTPLKDYRLQNRGGSGIKTANITPKVGPIISGQIIAGQEEIFALSARGQILRTQLSSIRTTGRAAQGVRIMNLEANDRLIGVVLI